MPPGVPNLINHLIPTRITDHAINSSTRGACEALMNAIDSAVRISMEIDVVIEKGINKGLPDVRVAYLNPTLDECAISCDKLLHEIINKPEMESNDLSLFLEGAKFLMEDISRKLQRVADLQAVVGGKDCVTGDELLMLDDSEFRRLFSELKDLVHCLKSSVGPVVQRQLDRIERLLYGVSTRAYAEDLREKQRYEDLALKFQMVWDEVQKLRRPDLKDKGGVEEPAGEEVERKGGEVQSSDD